jgi:thiol-disulfide isomerase/thioredoxin
MFRSPMTNMNSMQQIGTTKIGSGSSSYLNFFNKFSWSTIIYIVLVILLLMITYYYYTQWVKSKPAYNANRENGTDESTGSNKQAELMLFYVDWCPHCKTAKPEWENLKSTYENKTINGYNIIFTEYNCTNETAEIEELMNKYKIEGYPTIKLLKENQVIEYDAKPTKSTMEQFLNTVL